MLLKSAPWCLEKILAMDLSSLGQMPSTAPVKYTFLPGLRLSVGWGAFSCLLGLGLPVKERKAGGWLLVPSLQLLEWMACALCLSGYPAPENTFGATEKGFALAIFKHRRTVVLTFPL